MSVINFSKKLSAISSCFALLIVGSVVLLNTMSLDYYSVLSATKYGILGAVVAGTFGYLIGGTLEKARRR